MAVTTRSAAQPPVLPSGRLLELLRLRVAAPTIFAALSGIAFVILRPGVNDLWAARARASAVEHGVGLTYWFSWFGGGGAPGDHSLPRPPTPRPMRPGGPRPPPAPRGAPPAPPAPRGPASPAAR